MTSARVLLSVALYGGFGALAPLGMAAPLGVAASGQAAQSAPASRVVGAITAINGQSVTVKPDTGDPVTVTVSDSARILRAEPGTKTLSSATPIQFSDLAVGDRILMAVHPGADGGAATATTVVAMKKADVAQQQQAEQADWQRRGVGGLVKSVDASAGTMTVSAGSRTWTIHTTPKTVVRRYDAASIRFADARPATIDQVHVGDQLRALGDHDPASTDVAAEEVVFGTFRNIAATVISADAAANTVTVNDLATKKPVVIHISADSQLHKLPEMMAQALAARFKSGGQGAASGGATPKGAPSAPPQGGDHAPQAQPVAENGQGPRAGGARNGDLSQMLQRTPPLSLGDLHKGDAVMIVATQGTPAEATAVTLIAGVEPILSASPSASRDMFSASWNMGGGGEGEGAQ
ncbi:hypothetical protein [Silvibacterium dinghuense]|uniref:DUF5666 domain-containing protein n=1 Tax=Silvibacterium dinghuense TaxID=1560006 RepID=A0A4V1NVU7_9BACT|nr:hypothetical protein [Silvibacterium dinghuense]RXS97162.1 hypothetical protein ESZ00_04390 [Silvibacterium dinghuense]